jgi:hypothetical protein
VEKLACGSSGLSRTVKLKKKKKKKKLEKNAVIKYKCNSYLFFYVIPLERAEVIKIYATVYGIFQRILTENYK